jgi:hypothetical protein
MSKWIEVRLCNDESHCWSAKAEMTSRPNWFFASWIDINVLNPNGNPPYTILQVPFHDINDYRGIAWVYEWTGGNMAGEPPYYRRIQPDNKDIFREYRFKEPISDVRRTIVTKRV